ncbi:MAG: AAA family ATPase [Burkholderiales bacterium]|nr:AAA family ATPase [Burkholderiales bacterium]
MPGRVLTPAELARRSDPAALEALVAPAREPAAAPARQGLANPAAAIVGQQRAHEAVAYGIAMPRDGHHLFVMGPPGVGKRTLVRRAIEAHVARNGVERFDWAYVNNFAQPHQPRVLRLPRGRASALRQHMRALADDLRTMIPATFESEEYATAVERLNTEYKERAEHAVLEVGEQAQGQGLVMVRTPVGLSFAPRKPTPDGSDAVYTPEEFAALPEAERTRLQQALQAAQEQLVRVLRGTVRLRKEHADRLRALNRSMTMVAVEHAVDEVKDDYADLPEVLAYLEAVRDDVIDKADRFRSPQGEEASAGETTPVAEIDLSAYEVNVLVDAAGTDGAPIVTIDHPTHQQLIGRVDHLARMGTLLTDYRLVKPGALHRANGGFILIDAAKLLVQPFAWDALKRALTRREIRIESMAEMVSLVTTVQLEPEPIPLAVKVVLFGAREIGQLLQELDPDFGRLFRVVADFSDDLPRVDAVQRELVQSLTAQGAASALLPAGFGALARLVDHGARLAGDAQRLSASVQRLLDVLTEADQRARAAGHACIEASDVDGAIAARRRRASRIDERLREEVGRGMLMIATSGVRVGQINGLMVYESGGETFGEPVRISATTRLGDGEVIDIQRETHMGGPVHAKGVLILAAFLGARYSRFRAHAIFASLVFEQTYGIVEGDSASLAELLALLSSIADVPLKQSLAVTGSINQFGDVQPIGGVNEKIEGFFDVCAARGFDGTHGIVMPEANVAQLMLREDIVAAVAGGRFAIHAVRHADEAIEVMTGLAAGEPHAPHADTVNGRIVARLREYARLHGGEQRWPRRHRGGASPSVHADGARTAPPKGRAR